MSDPRPSPSESSPITVFLALLAVITSTLICFMLPELFASTARVRASRPAGGTNSSGPLDVTELATECEIVRSEVVLRPVIATYDLNLHWGRKYSGGRFKTADTLKMLQHVLEVRPVNNTELLEIR